MRVLLYAAVKFQLLTHLFAAIDYVSRARHHADAAHGEKR